MSHETPIRRPSEISDSLTPAFGRAVAGTELGVAAGKILQRTDARKQSRRRDDSPHARDDRSRAKATAHDLGSVPAGGRR